MEAVPIRNCVSGVTGTRASRSAQPKPSAHATSPATPTATESPGRLRSTSAERTIRRPSAAASAQRDGGADRSTAGTSAGAGCSGGAGVVRNAHSPSVAISSSPPSVATGAKYVSIQPVDTVASTRGRTL